MFRLFQRLACIPLVTFQIIPGGERERKEEGGITLATTAFRDLMNLRADKKAPILLGFSFDALDPYFLYLERPQTSFLGLFPIKPK